MSQDFGFIDDLKKPITNIGIFLGVCLFLILYSWAWPSSLWLTIAIYFWFRVRSDDGPFFSALTSTLLPFVCGLSIIVMLQILVKVIDMEAQTLWRIESSLLKINDILPSWINFSWLQFCLIILILFFIHLSLPFLTPVKHFLFAIKYLKIFCAVTAALASFTFFSQQGNLESLAEPKRNLVARISSVRLENWNMGMDIIAKKSVIELISIMSMDTKAALFNLPQLSYINSRGSSRYSKYEIDNGETIVNLANDSLESKIRSKITQANIALDIKVQLPYEDTNLKSHELYQQLKDEENRRILINNEKEEVNAALEASINKLTGNMTDTATELVKSLIAHLLHEYTGLLVNQITATSKRTASNYLDKIRKPIINKLVHHGAKLWVNIADLNSSTQSRNLFFEACNVELVKAEKFLVDAIKNRSYSTLVDSFHSYSVANIIYTERLSRYGYVELDKSINILHDKIRSSADLVIQADEMRQKEERQKELNRRQREFKHVTRRVRGR